MLRQDTMCMLFVSVLASLDIDFDSLTFSNHKLDVDLYDTQKII